MTRAETEDEKDERAVRRRKRDLVFALVVLLVTALFAWAVWQ